MCMQHAKAAELTHRRRVAEGDVLLDRPETFERPKPVYQVCKGRLALLSTPLLLIPRCAFLIKAWTRCPVPQKVVLPPRNTFHYWYVVTASFLCHLMNSL